MGTSPAHPHVASALSYCRGVLDGSILACRLVRLACQRHLDDLERVGSPDWPYRFDPDLAERHCRHRELFPHSKGKWAAAGELFRLEPWQCFADCSIFGWVKKSDGLRRFRRVYIEVPRKNGKSEWAAEIGLDGISLDGENGAEVYCGASTERQAHKVFRPAWLKAKRTAEFREFYGVEISGTEKNPRSIYRVGRDGTDDSMFKPLIGNPGDGDSPHFAIIDEYHEHDSDAMVETMKTGMAARPQPLLFMITTAGADTASPCYHQHQEAIDVLEGTTRDEELFALIYGLDRDDDWQAEESLRKANPNWGVSVITENLLADLQEAIKTPRKQAAFKTKHLNIWITSRSPWIPPERWHPCAEAVIDPRDYIDWHHYIGLDLSSKKDLTAMVSVFSRIDEPEYRAIGRFYVPRDRVEESPNATAYRGWIADGHLIETPGSQVHQVRIFDDIMALHEQCPVTLVVADPWGFQWMGPELASKGLEAMELPQTTKYVSDPMKHVEAMLPEGKFKHDGNPVLSWGVFNVVAREDPRDNLFPRKENQERKIDPARALLNAMYPALLSMAGEGGPSVYEERGIIAL